jgi:hypothetical protein
VAVSAFQEHEYQYLFSKWMTEHGKQYDMTQVRVTMSSREGVLFPAQCFMLSAMP